MNPAFETWTKGGIKYIAVPQNGGFAVLAETGEWYGCFLSVASFRKRQDSDILDAPLSARATLAVRTYEQAP